MDESSGALRYPVGLDRGLGTIANEKDYGEYVEQLIKQVLLTSSGERISRPEFGCGIRRMVFAPLTDVTDSLTKITVVGALEEWLGDLIAVDDVTVTTMDETLHVGIAYALRARHERRYLNLEVTL